METRAIYTRPEKRYIPVEGIGIKGKHHGSESGPFLINVMNDGKQQWLALLKDGSAKLLSQVPDRSLLASSVSEAIRAANLYDEHQATRKAAEARGITVVPEEKGRITLAAAVEHFLEEKKDKGLQESSLNDYEQILRQFLSMLPPNIRYVDQIVETETKRGIPKRTSSTLKQFMRALQDQGYSARTVSNKMSAVIFMLKEAGIAMPSKLVEIPDFEEEPAEPYRKEDLKKLFDAMDDEELVRYTFFLVTACREQEVAHAQWSDLIVDSKGVPHYRVQAKEYERTDGERRKWTPKSHEQRQIPLRDDLVDLLKLRKESSKSKWVFPNEDGNPEGHFLRKFKKIAFRAGLNCGECKTTRMEGRYERKPVEKTCATYGDCCEKHYLHRLRKTRATFWHSLNVPLRTIQTYLGHKSLETTQKYLGVEDAAAIQDKINRPMF